MTPLLIAILVLAQVAEHANKGYVTEEQRAGMAKRLADPSREAELRPRELIARAGIKTGMTVADVGTGVGLLLPYLSEAVGSGGKVIAEDIFPDFLAQARERAASHKLGNITFVQGTVRSAALPAASSDVALIVDAYHHFDHPAEMLASIRAGLKPGGRLVVVELYKRSNSDPEHVRLDEKEALAEIGKYGFALVESGPLGDRQYLAIFRPK